MEEMIYALEKELDILKRNIIDQQSKVAEEIKNALLNIPAFVAVR